MSLEPAGVTLRLARSPERVADLVAAGVCTSLRAAVAGRGAADLCLAGGRTPRLLHAALVRQRFEHWSRVHIWFGDERCVPPDHAESNARMARETLLEHVDVSERHVHRLAGELDPQTAAQQYHAALQDLAERRAQDVPSFDVLVLGMGEDGHTASIFPGSPLLEGRDGRQAWCVAEYVAHLHAWRLTLTPAVLRAAATTVVLVTGPRKHDALVRVLTRAGSLQQVPARLLEDARGHVAWCVDDGALFGQADRRDHAGG